MHLIYLRGGLKIFYNLFASVFNFGEFPHFLNLKNKILTHRKDVCEKNGPSMPDFEINNDLKKFLLSYLMYSQI
jgi:hypothetical protein